MRTGGFTVVFARFGYAFLPALALPGVIGSATLAFLVSFEEVVVGLFLVGLRLTMLSAAMFRYQQSRRGGQV